MYRINLYREYGVRQVDRRRSTVRTALLSGILGVQVLFIVTLVLSSHLLKERIVRLREEVVCLESEVQGRSAEPMLFDLSAAREVLTLRRHRVDWYPKLVDLTNALDPSLSLEALYSLPSDASHSARLEIRGQSPSGGDANAVFRFVDGLRREPGYAADFAAIRLSTIEGEEDNRFQVVCEAPEKANELGGDVAGGNP